MTEAIDTLQNLNYDPTDTVKAFKNEVVGSVPEMSREETATHLKLIWEIDKELKKHNLDPARKPIIEQLKHEEVNSVVVGNMRLAVEPAHFIASATGVPVEELFSESYFAMYKGVLSYEKNSEYAFSSHLIRNLKWHYYKYISDSENLIKRPTYWNDESRNIKKREDIYRRDYTNEELILLTFYPNAWSDYIKAKNEGNRHASNVRHFLSHMEIGKKYRQDEDYPTLKRFKGNVKRVKELNNLNNIIYFEDEKYAGSYEGDEYIPKTHITTIGESLVDPDNPIEEVDEKIRLENLQAELQRIFESGGLTSLQKSTLIKRFNLTHSERGEQTLEEIAQQYGLGKERIRQVEAKALRKLRHPTQSRALREFYK